MTLPALAALTLLQIAGILLVRSLGRTAVAVSVADIIGPLVIGGALALLL